MNLHNLEELIVRQNPHWISNTSIDTGFKRDIFDEFSKELIKEKLILTINGPRRSGKTFLMNQGMDWLIKTKGINLKNVCYFQFSASLNEKDIVNNIVELFVKKYAAEGQKYIFLDEVQNIDYWQDQIKNIYDSTNDVKFIVSGSTSLFYRQKSKESLAGRIYKLKIGALNFHEYLRFKKVEEPSIDRAKFVSNLKVYETEFRKYLSFGQYPEIVANPEIDPKKYIQDLSDQIINFDIPYFATKVNRQLFLDLIKTLSFDLAEEFSLSNVSKKLGVDRREMGEYLKILQELSLFGVCYNHSFKSMRRKLSGSKKIYSMNLNLSLNINGFDESYLNDNRVYGKYFENYVYMRLFDKFKDVEYFREEGKEIDFIAGDNSYEIKTSTDKSVVGHEELSVRLKKKFNLVSKNEVYLL